MQVSLATPPVSIPLAMGPLGLDPSETLIAAFCHSTIVSLDVLGVSAVFKATANVKLSDNYLHLNQEELPSSNLLERRFYLLGILF